LDYHGRYAYRMKRSTSTKLALATLFAAPLSAQDSATEPDGRPATEAETPQVVDEVIVRGRRLSEIDNDLRIYIDRFLDDVAAPTEGRGYARWHREVCLGVHNLERSAAQYLVDRISRLALDVGLEPGEPGCRPHVNIIFTLDAAGLAAQMVEREPRVFRAAGGFLDTDLGFAALDEFVKSDKAVRWWHVNLPVDARMGVPALEMPQAVGLCGGPHCPPRIAVAGPSRIHSGVVDALQYVIIVVDATKLSGTTWQQLGDYLAVVSLAQINPRTDPTSFDTILNVFSNPTAYSGLTDWDRSYVQALYAIDQERDARLQQNEIVSRIARRELGFTK
jgi:hypothetical protein